MSQVTKRVGLEVLRVVRHRWTQRDREDVRIRLRLHECGAALSGDSHFDHVKPLSEGGEDSITAVAALCVCCHGGKSERERLGAVYARPLYSSLNRDVLESLLDAPKPQHVVLGDGQERCLEIDAIGCRSNDLLKAGVPFPVATVADTIEAYDPGAPRADFYFIDAGEPLDDPLASALDLTGTHCSGRTRS